MNHFCKCRKSAWIGVCVLILFGSFRLFAQQPGVLQQKITIKTGKLPIAKALAELGKKAGCTFAYGDELIGSKKLVALNYKNTTLKTILEDLLGATPDRLMVQGNVVHIKAGIPFKREATTASQKDTAQSAWSFDLNPVVVTGQFRPQSLNKSVYRVEVIDKRQIENMAVSTVAELLKQQLNIEIENDAGVGRSKIRVLGLNSQYTKILMDNIPIAGDENMGNDVDLSTISLDDVEQVEIIKGAMGVDYGANSIAGVVNIITRKSSRNKTDIRLEIQEESIGKEYNLQPGYSAKGRHIQRINAMHNINSQLIFGVSASRDRFNGLWGEYEGVAPTMERSNKRGYDWSPKTSWNGNTFLSYSLNSIRAFYKFSYFTSDVTQHGRLAEPFRLEDERLVVNAGVNNDYRNERYNHHLNVRGDFWKNAHFSIDASYQKNGLEHRRQAINLWDNSVLSKANGIPGSTRLKATDWTKHYQSYGFYSKGTLLKTIVADKLDANIGYELDNTTGDQGQTQWFNDVALNQPVQQTLFTGSGYASLEWNVTPKIMIRPGFRANYSSHLNMRTNESVTTRYRLNERNDLRLILGTSTRFPNYNEMFMRFVDAVHEYVGNPDLRPEYGQSAELQWTHRREMHNDVYLETNISTMYQYIRDRIVDVTYQSDRGGVVTGTNTFTNENEYNGLLAQADVRLVSEKFHFAVGGSFHGYKGNDDETINTYDKYLTNTQINSNASYLLPWGLRVAAFYRFVGKQPIYTFIPPSVNNEDPSAYTKVLNLTDTYHNIDFNVSKSLLNDKIELRIGVRNLLDVTDLRYKPVVEPFDVPMEVLMPNRVLRLYYGRTVFMKLTYKI